MADRGYREWQRQNVQSGYAGCSIEEQVARGRRSGLDLATVCNRIVYGMIQAGTASDDAMLEVFTAIAMRGHHGLGGIIGNEFLLEAYLTINLVGYESLDHVSTTNVNGRRVDVFLKEQKGYLRWEPDIHGLMISPLMIDSPFAICEEVNAKIPLTPEDINTHRIYWTDVTAEVLAELLLVP